MKVVVKKIDAMKRELHFEIGKDRVQAKQDEVYHEVARVAKIKGFRPGKAPRPMVEAQYGTVIKEETIKKIIPEAYQEGIEQEKLSPLDYPEIRDVEFKNGGVVFKADIEIKPEIKLANYKGIPVTRKSAKVTDEEINQTLEYFKKGKGAGSEIEINDDFVKGLGYPTVAAFKESLARQMEIDKDRHNRADVERQITDHLIKSIKVTVPPSFLEKQLAHRIADLKKRLKNQGLSDEDAEKRQEQMRKDLKESVERDVKLFLIFDRIAQEENVTVAENENLAVKVLELLMKEAAWTDEAKS